jgi:hypothetical protein
MAQATLRSMKQVIRQRERNGGQYAAYERCSVCGCKVTDQDSYYNEYTGDAACSPCCELTNEQQEAIINTRENTMNTTDIDTTDITTTVARPEPETVKAPKKSRARKPQPVQIAPEPEADMVPDIDSGINQELAEWMAADQAIDAGEFSGDFDYGTGNADIDALNRDLANGVMDLEPVAQPEPEPEPVAETATSVDLSDLAEAKPVRKARKPKTPLKAADVVQTAPKPEPEPAPEPVATQEPVAATQGSKKGKKAQAATAPAPVAQNGTEPTFRGMTEPELRKHHRCVLYGWLGETGYKLRSTMGKDELIAEMLSITPAPVDDATRVKRIKVRIASAKLAIENAQEALDRNNALVAGLEAELAGLTASAN